MKRKIYNKLIDWKKSAQHPPLLIVGARQVGKTYIINEFGKNEFKNVVFCNLEKDFKIQRIFQQDLDPSRIIKDLERIFKMSIIPSETLIVFDEIQSCPNALTSLKYFNEEHKEYYIIASGSLLGVALNREKYSFPVGKVKTLTLYPLDFEEFLLAKNEKSLISEIKKCFESSKPLDEIFHEDALKLYKEYLYVGGMPEVVNLYIQFGINSVLREKQIEIINNYLDDMGKYNTTINTNKSRLVFNNVSKQLAKENKKFKYSIIRTGARASEYEFALNWLCTSGITKKIFKLESIKIPLNVYSSSSDFKLYLNDVGLLCALQHIEFDDIISPKNILKEFMGGLTENYVFNELKTKELELYYWTNENTAEIDFITRLNLEIIPIEAKSNTNNKSKSLNIYVERYKPKYSIRISAKNFGFDNNIKSVPLYSVFCINNKD